MGPSIIGRKQYPVLWGYSIHPTRGWGRGARAAQPTHIGDRVKGVHIYIVHKTAISRTYIMPSVPSSRVSMHNQCTTNILVYTTHIHCRCILLASGCILMCIQNYTCYLYTQANYIKPLHVTGLMYCVIIRLVC